MLRASEKREFFFGDGFEASFEGFEKDFSSTSWFDTRFVSLNEAAVSQSFKMIGGSLSGRGTVFY